MIAYLFPGQGSQKRGMGEKLFDKYTSLADEASEILGYNIRELCVVDEHRLLNQTQYTQPALYVVNALSYLDRQETMSRPDFVLGHSLGEYVALFAAGAFSFETGLKLVKQRAEIMGRVKNGGMAALLGLKMDAVRKILVENSYSSIDIANYNSAEQIVISGLRDDIISAQKVFEANGAKLYYPLNVSGAFHSRYMKEAEDAFATAVAHVHFSPLQIPVISNVLARPYEDGRIGELLTTQITSQVKWYESISFLLHNGVSAFQEVGPGDVLTKMQGFIAAAPMPAQVAGFTPVQPPVKRLEQLAPPEGKEDAITDELPAYCRQLIGDEVLEGEEPLFTAAHLGSAGFRKLYKVKYAYAAGAMFYGISSKEFVARMGRAGLLSFYGSKGKSLAEIEAAILYFQGLPSLPYGIHLWHQPDDASAEMALVALLQKHQVSVVEAGGYTTLSEAIVYYRVSGLVRGENGRTVIRHHILAKAARPDIAALFLQPPPEKIVEQLLASGKITKEQALMAATVPMADDICAEAEGTGMGGRKMPYALITVFRQQRDQLARRFGYHEAPRIGLAGGIGTPEAAAGAFLTGAEFILTGSVNQCTVEAGTSREVKDMLQETGIQDTDYVPGEELFEFGARIQVLKKGLFFPARAARLYEFYRMYTSLDELDPKDRTQLETRYFGATLDAVFEELKQTLSQATIASAMQHPRHKMALVFRQYFEKSMKAALAGDQAARLDYQIQSSSALGSFNEWVKDTPLRHWNNRHGDSIALLLLTGAAAYLSRFYDTALVARESRAMIPA